MSDISMTSQATDPLPFGVLYKQIAMNACMAPRASTLNDLGIHGFDLNRVDVHSGSECPAVVKPVYTFSYVFADERIWIMAVIAYGHGMMRGMIPRAKVLAHDVAIGTDFRVVG